MEKMPEKVVTKVKEENSCAICMKTYSKGDKVFFLGCKHHFHAPCVRPWFEKSHCCPLCRFDINLNLPASEAKNFQVNEEEENDDYGGEFY
jgi:E3 ubiquitin-protein ligase AIP2